MEVVEHPARWKTLLAFAIIYLVWGSTFFAIRVGVREVPPLLFAAMRFTVAGAALFGWMIARGAKLPSRHQWASIGVISLMIFVCDYGLLFWAEQRVPSGVAAVMMATVPVSLAVLEIVFLRTQRLTVRLAAALLIGIAGVAVLTGSSLHLDLGGAAIDTGGAVALLIGAVGWSIGSVLSRRLPLPESKPVSSGAQMLVGGLMLALIAVGSGELRGFELGAVSRGAWIALIYLIVMGSIVGFTVYVWLIHHESPTKVGTYAYVNPVVAVLLGYFFAAEAIGLRTLIGTLCVLVSVVVITTAKAKRETLNRPPRLPEGRRKGTRDGSARLPLIRVYA